MAQSTMHSLGGVVVPPQFFPKIPFISFKVKRKRGVSLPFKSPRASPTEIKGRYRLLFHSAIGFHNLTDNISTAKPR